MVWSCDQTRFGRARSGGSVERDALALVCAIIFVLFVVSFHLYFLSRHFSSHGHVTDTCAALS